MSLPDLRKVIAARPPFSQIRKLIEGSGRLVAVEEMAPEAKPLFVSCIAAARKGPVVVIAYSEEEAERLYEGLLAYGLPAELTHLAPVADSLLYQDGPPDWLVVGARVRALASLASGQSCIIVAPLASALALTVDRATFAAAVQRVSKDEVLDVGKLALALDDRGYRRVDLVSEQGEFSVRGGLLDVWPPTQARPIRIEMFDDVVESVRDFDPESQRSTGQVDEVLIPPAREVFAASEADLAHWQRSADVLKKHLEEQVEALAAQGKGPDADALELRVSEQLESMRLGAGFNGLEYFIPYLARQPECLLDWLPESALVLWDEPNLCKGHLERHLEEQAEVLTSRTQRGQALALDRDHSAAFTKGRESILKRRTIVFTSLPQTGNWLQTPHHLKLPSAGMDSFGSQVGVFAENVKTWLEHEWSVVVVTGQVMRLGQTMLELGIRPIRELKGELEPGVTMIQGNLETGYRLLEQQVIVIAEVDIFGAKSPRRPRISSRESRPIHSISDINIGDYIVHVHHGIGVYRGLVQREGQYGTRDYLLLEYAGGDKLFVPADQTDRVQRYSGADGGPPVIHRLGGSDWARTKKKVKESVKQIAKELLQVYAAREALGGHSYPPDEPWQAEMEQAFPYVETPDQQRAIDEVKQDLEEPKPMDRLVCGDVGFGKTEVAIRAAFKVVLEGKQVGVLCPTTVLAQQHFNTFSERLAAFPVKVEMLSRFRSAKEQRRILADLAAGNVDIVIGTHRLLSKDIKFSDLGLLVVDEEQRFGVTHKERLKQMRVSVDVLTLTATPIPRTLHMSLAGIRDMSVINQAPEGRMPVRTYVREFDDDLVREAIVRELDRDGQVYFVHNRVESIQNIADHVSRLVPYAKIGVGHGQLDEDELEQVMFDFYHQKFDVLVCTTIIESGLDIPSVNTIIVNNADKMGLAQLYQLRGRVGRSDRQAYAYLLYKSEDILTEIAEKRLSAIREFADLGSGFKVAMRDLEIRGAGNLLGPEQHGQMVSVGFDMYCHLLAQAVKELKGEPITEEKPLPRVELPVEAYIPQDYITSEQMRIAVYRKMGAADSEQAVSTLEEELDDRFGPPPSPVRCALSVIRLKVQCREMGIASITEEQGRLIVMMETGVVIDPAAMRPLAMAFPEHWWEPNRVRLKLGGSDPIELISEFLRLVARSLVRSRDSGAGRS